MELTNEARQRAQNSSVGPTETVKAYKDTSSLRKVNQQNVYNVNIPFSKDAKLTPQKPGSAAGRQPDSESKAFDKKKFSQSHAATFLSNTSRNSVTGRSDLEAVLARK